MYRQNHTKSVIRDLTTLSKTDATRILDIIEKELVKNPESYPVLKGKFTGLRKYRSRDIWVISSIVGADVLILRIANRKDLYRHES